MTFTHAALTALMIRYLHERDPRLLPPGVGVSDWLGRALIDDSVKRRVLRHALRVGGPQPILDVGDALRDATYLPPVRVLLASPDTQVLAEKWMRLEGYYHSTHRTRIDAEVPGTWRCRHYATQGAPPVMAEHYLICGVLRGLLRTFGARNVKLDQLPTRAGRWTFRWLPGPSRSAEPAWRRGEDVEARLGRSIAGDPAREWSLQAAARALACSTRTLQRELAATGNRFATVLRSSRVSMASKMLLDGDESLADIGYACGFADQAHFQRSFKTVVGMTPRNYRRSAR